MPLRIAPYQQQVGLSVVGAPRASSPAVVDPTGAAVQSLAKDVQTVAEGFYERSREADYQDRIGKYTAELSQLELSFERDQDFRTSPQRFKEQAEALRDKYLDGVTDQAVATAFKKQAGTLTTAKHINVIKDAWRREADYSVASLDENLDTYATVAANAKNPGEAAVVENQARIAISSAQSRGFLSAVDAGKRERGFLAKRDSAIVVRDMSIDPLMTATKLSLDPTYVQNVDPVARERYVDQAFRRAESDQRRGDAAAERARKARGDELYKDALKRHSSGQLTTDYVDHIKPFVEPNEYKALLGMLSGVDRDDEPAAFSELQGLVYSNPAEAEKRAYVLHAQRKIKNETLTATLSRAREIGRQEGPRTEYERSRQFITNAIKPSDLVPDPAASARFALAMREFDDYAGGAQRPDADLRKKADELLKRYSIVNMVELAQKTSAGAQPTPEAQLQALHRDAEKLISDRDAKKITPQEFNRKMETLDRARKAAEKAARINGGK